MTIRLRSLSSPLRPSSDAQLCRGLLYGQEFSHMHPYQRKSRPLVYHVDGSRQLPSQCRLASKKQEVFCRGSRLLLECGSPLLSQGDPLKLPIFDSEAQKQLLSAHLLPL